MFPLTRPSRQAAATVALVALTVVPTAYVALTAWRISRPGHRHEVEAALGRALGLQVTLDAVRYPRPGEVEYRGVVLRLEEPRHRGLTEVARASRVRLRRGDRELTLEADGLRLRADSPRAAMAQVGAVLQRSGGAAYERVSLTAPDCTLDLGAGVAPYRLREVIGQFLADRAAATVRASYRVADPKGPASAPGTRCELTLTRDRRADPVRTTLALRTMEGLPLPARVLDPFFDSADWLGSAARVEGALTLRQDGSKDWEAEFQGNLLDIDLSELVNRRFPSHSVRGKARLAVASARWAERPGQGYGWVEAQGEMTAGPGVIGYGLLQALRTEMKFRPAPRLARVVSAGQVDLDFRALAFTFAMTPDGEIKVGGALGTEYEADAVLVGRTEPLAFAPPGAANVHGLIKTLVPVTAINRAEMVPLTERSRILLCLPVPPEPAAKRIGGN
jgi:hypothetical protein